MKIKLLSSLPYGITKRMGIFHYNKWYPFPEYVVPDSFNVRKPSEKFPYSYLRHIYTKKYTKLLFKHKPEKFLEINNYMKNCVIAESEEEEKCLQYKKIISKLMFMRINVANYNKYEIFFDEHSEDLYKYMQKQKNKQDEYIAFKLEELLDVN